MKIRFLAGRILIESGQVARDQTIAADLAKEIQADPQANAKILEGLAALAGNDRRAGDQKPFGRERDPGHLDRPFRSRPRVSGGRQYPQADSAFDRCLKRRGEALSLFLDRNPRPVTCLRRPTIKAGFAKN